MEYSFFLFLLGALATVLLTPLSIRLATAMGAVDIPDGGRHRHARPTPRLGGLAIVLSLLICAPLLPREPLVLAWLSGGALLAALGITDDLFSLSPAVKLIAEIAIATLPIAFGLAPTHLVLGALSLPLARPWGALFCLFYVVLLANAINLTDGMDALAATTCFLSGGTLFLYMHAPAALLFSGAVLGFLPYNRLALSPIGKEKTLPTRSFLGDTGALFLGYSVALFSLAKPRFSLLLPLVLALPLFDLSRVFLSRSLRGKKPFAADRSHLHHRLADRGLSQERILLLFALATLFFSTVFLLLVRVI